MTSRALLFCNRRRRWRQPLSASPFSRVLFCFKGKVDSPISGPWWRTWTASRKGFEWSDGESSDKFSTGYEQTAGNKINGTKRGKTKCNTSRVSSYTRETKWSFKKITVRWTISNNEAWEMYSLQFVPSSSVILTGDLWNSESPCTRPTLLTTHTHTNQLAM